MSTKSVTITTPNQPLLYLNAQTIALEPSQPKNSGKKIVLECPRCCWIFEAQRPDNRHPTCTFNKPETAKTKNSIIEELRICRNPKCKKQFSLYWYKTAASNSSA